MNILDVLSLNGHFKRVASTNGGEYAGPCPFCGGRDRFRVWPEEDKGRFWCRGCGKSGDAIDYLREMRGLSFQEACLELSIEPHRERQHRPIEERGFTPSETTTPGPLWQRKAGEFLEQAERTLWKHPEALDFLHGRGLRDDTIRGARLGWNPRGRYEQRESWGLLPEKDEKGKDKALWLPGGLVIPLVSKGAVLRLRIRRPEGETRYYNVPGGDMRPMTFDLGREILLVVESEIDGLLVNQETGELVGVIALGSATIRPDQQLDEILRGSKSILVSLDSDTPGAKEAWSFWLKKYQNSRRWPVAVGKDPSEAFQKGLSIRAWVEAGLTINPSSLLREKPTEAVIKPFPKEWLERYDDTQLERLAIMTVDGRLSDIEAERLSLSRNSQGVAVNGG